MSYTRRALGTVARCTPRRRRSCSRRRSRSGSPSRLAAVRSRASVSPPERSASLSSSPPSSPQLEPLANHTFLWAHLLQNVVLAEWAPVLLLLAVPPRLAERAAGFPLFRPVRRAAALAGRLLHVAPAADLRRGASQSALAPARRALHVFRGGDLRLVARRPRQVLGRREGRLPLRRLRARLAARPDARADPARDLSLLRPRATDVGPSPLADQQIAGVTMAAEEAIVFFGAFAGYLLRFLADEQAAGSFNPSASAPAARAPQAGLRAAPGSARPRH